MVEKVYPMTLEGKEKLEQELEELKTIKRKEIVERIKIARSFGDLSENSEYESAKDEQAFVEGRITTLENMIRFAEIIDNDGVDQDEVSIGKTVTFQELPDGEEEEERVAVAESNFNSESERHSGDGRKKSRPVTSVNR